jgi:hypothetical protein
MPPIIGYDVLGNPIYSSPPTGAVNPYASPYPGGYPGYGSPYPPMQPPQQQPNPFEWFLLANLLNDGKKTPLTFSMPFPGMGGLGFGIPLW